MRRGLRVAVGLISRVSPQLYRDSLSERPPDDIQQEKASPLRFHGILLGVQETRVRSLVWEDPTRHRAATPRRVSGT